MSITLDFETMGNNLFQIGDDLTMKNASDNKSCFEVDGDSFSMSLADHLQVVAVQREIIVCMASIAPCFL